MDDELSVIVLGDSSHTYGLVVDRFLGERELVVQPLDAQLGKIKDIAAGALMEDGSPVLIVDAEDLIRSMDKLVSGGRLSKVQRQDAAAGRKRKRVLVVDDSLTVRELERKLLGNRGYDVEVAVDGMDGWNAVRTGHFDLVVTDIDMPRMDGIELVTLINKDPNLKSLPVMVVSYKDRDEDRQRGLEAGAALLPDQGQLSRRDAAAGGRRPDRRGRRVRIGIVNDLPGETEVLRQAVALKPEHQVIWIAKTGAEAVERCAKETPDLVLMDLLAGMDGVEATRRIMAGAPCAILIVTDSVQVERGARVRGDGPRRARRGRHARSGDRQSAGQRGAAAGENRHRLAPHRREGRTTRRGCRPRHRAPSLRRHPLVAIGASAGGPAALATVLRGLPRDFPAAIVIVQHVEAQFAGGMADWLSEQSALPVTVAKEGEQPGGRQRAARRHERPSGVEERESARLHAGAARLCLPPVGRRVFRERQPALAGRRGRRAVDRAWGATARSA